MVSLLHLLIVVFHMSLLVVFAKLLVSLLGRIWRGFKTLVFLVFFGRKSSLRTSLVALIIVIEILLGRALVLVVAKLLFSSNIFLKQSLLFWKKIFLVVFGGKNSLSSKWALLDEEIQKLSLLLFAKFFLKQIGNLFDLFFVDNFWWKSLR